MKFLRSKLILSQMRYNLEYINEMIRDLCLSVYYSSDAKVLMYFDEDETYNEMSLINRINTLRIRSNSFIHSIHIYNNKKETLYSTYHSVKIQDDVSMDIITNTYPLPILKQVIRNFHDNLTGEDTTVITLKEYFNQIYTSLLSIAGIALVLATFVYYLMSRRLYIPVRNIL